MLTIKKGDFIISSIISLLNLACCVTKTKIMSYSKNDKLPNSWIFLDKVLDKVSFILLLNMNNS